MNMHALNNIRSSSTILPAKSINPVIDSSTKSSGLHIENDANVKPKSDSLGSPLRSPNNLKDLGGVQTLQKSNSVQTENKNADDTKSKDSSKGGVGKKGKSDMLQKNELTEVTKRFTKFKSFHTKTYVCKYCCRRFFSESQLQQHSHSHGDKNTHICYLCNHQAASFSALMTHYLKHSGSKGNDKLEKIYAKSKADFSNIQFNISSRPKPSLQCPKCCQSFISKLKLQNHICSAKMTEKKSYNCAYCGRVSYTVEDYRNCVQSHSETPFVCSYCKRKFQRKKHLDIHLKQCKTSAEKMEVYKCETCAVFCCNNKKDLDQHIKDCIKTDSQTYVCVHCDSKFSEKTTYDDHSKTCLSCKDVKLVVVKKRGRKPKSVQKKSAKFICSACGDTFRSKVELKQHEKTCIMDEDDDDDMYDDVASMYSRKETLANINKRSKPAQGSSLLNKTNFQNSDADILLETTFERQSETTVQKKRKTSFNNNVYSEINSSCDEDVLPLSKTIPSEINEDYSLKKSISVKDNTSARRSTRLVRRKSSLSDDEEVIKRKRIFKLKISKPRISIKPKFRRGKPPKNANATFLCNVCDFSFCSKSTLQRHTRMHSGNPWYTCGFCGKFFFRKDVYIRHESNVHNNSTKTVFCCCYCKLEFADSIALRAHVLDTHKDSAFLPIRPKFPKGEIKQETKFLNEMGEFVEPTVYDSDKFINYIPHIEDIKTNFDDDYKDNKIKTVKIYKKRGPKKKGMKLINSENESEHFQTPEKSEASLDQLNTTKSDHLGAPDHSFISSENSNALRCILCFKQFSDKSTFDAHGKTTHEIVDWYQCLVCSASGPKQAMLEHMFTHMFKIGTFVVNSDTRNFDAIASCLQLQNHLKIDDKTAGEINASSANVMPSETVDMVNDEELPPLREFGVCPCVEGKFKQSDNEMPDLEKEAELLTEPNSTHSEEVTENISAYNTATDEDHSSTESEIDLSDCLKSTNSAPGTKLAPLFATMKEDEIIIAYDKETITHDKVVAHDNDEKEPSETEGGNKNLSDSITSSDHNCTMTDISVKFDNVHREGNNTNIVDSKMLDNIKVSESCNVLHKNKVCEESDLSVSTGENISFTCIAGSEKKITKDLSKATDTVKKNAKKTVPKSVNTSQKERTKTDLKASTKNRAVKHQKLKVEELKSAVKSNSGKKGVKSSNLLQEENMSDVQNICNVKEDIARKDVKSKNLLEEKAMPKEYLNALNNKNVFKINVKNQLQKSKTNSEKEGKLKTESNLSNDSSTIKSNNEEEDIKSHNLVQDKKKTEKMVSVLRINSAVKEDSGRKGAGLPNLVQKRKYSQGALNLSSVKSKAEKDVKSINILQKDKAAKEELNVSSIQNSGGSNTRKKCLRIPNILRQKKTKLTRTTPIKTSDMRTFIEPTIVFQKEEIGQSSLKMNADKIIVNESNNVLQEGEKIKEKRDLCNVISPVNLDSSEVNVKPCKTLQNEEKTDTTETNNSKIGNEFYNILEKLRKEKIDPSNDLSPVKINDPKINVKFYNVSQENTDPFVDATSIKTDDPRSVIETFASSQEDEKMKEKTNLSCITIPVRKNDQKIGVLSKDFSPKKTKIDFSNVSRPIKNCVESTEESVIKELKFFDTNPGISFDKLSLPERKTTVEQNMFTISNPIDSNFDKFLDHPVKSTYERTSTLEPNVAVISNLVLSNFENEMEHNLSTISNPVKNNFEKTALEPNVSNVSGPVKSNFQRETEHAVSAISSPVKSNFERNTPLEHNVTAISSPVKSNYESKTFEYNVSTISSPVKSGLEKTALETNMSIIPSLVKSNFERKTREPNLSPIPSLVKSNFERKSTLGQTVSKISSYKKSNLERKTTLEQNVSTTSSLVLSNFERKRNKSSNMSQVIHDKKEGKGLKVKEATSSVLTSPLKPSRIKSQNSPMKETTKELNVAGVVTSSVITSLKPQKTGKTKEKSNAPSYSEWITRLNSATTSLGAYAKAPLIFDRQETKSEVTNIAPVNMSVNFKTFNTLDEKEAKELNLSNVTYSSQSSLQDLSFQTENFQESESFSQLRYLLQKPSKLLSENNENKITIYPASQDTEGSGQESSNPFVAYVNTAENQNLVEAVSFPETKFTFEMPKQSSNIFTNDDINYSTQASPDIKQPNTCLKFDINQSRGEVSGVNLITTSLNPMSQSYVQDQSTENLFKACPPQSTILDFSDLLQHSFENISPSEDNIFSYPTTTPAKEVNFLSGVTSREEVHTPDCTDIVNYESELLNSTLKCKDCNLCFNNNYDLNRHTCVSTKNQIFEGIDLSFKPKIPSQPLNFMTNQNKVPCITSTSSQKFSVLVSPKSTETPMCSSSMSPQLQTLQFMGNPNKVSCITNTSEQRLIAPSLTKYSSETFVVQPGVEQEQYHKPVLLPNLPQSGNKCNKCQRTFRDIGELMKHSLTCLKSLFFKTAQTNNFVIPVPQSESLQTLLLRDLPNTTFSNVPSLSPSKESSHKTSDDLKHLFDS